MVIYEYYDEIFYDAKNFREYIKKNIKEYLNDNYHGSDFIGGFLPASEIFDLYSEEEQNEIIEQCIIQIAKNDLIIKKI